MMDPVDSRAGSEQSMMDPVDSRAGSEQSMMDPVDSRAGSEQSVMDPVDSMAGSEQSMMDHVDSKVGSEQSMMDPVDNMAGSELKGKSVVKRKAPSKKDSKLPKLQRLCPLTSTHTGCRQSEWSGDGVHTKMSINTMFRTSFELQQAETLNTAIESGHSSNTDRNIVDKLFQDFVAIKMKEVNDGNKSRSEKARSEVTDAKDLTSMSMEEIGRLLDAEITSIQSRSVMSSLYDDLMEGDVGGHHEGCNDGSAETYNSLKRQSVEEFPLHSSEDNLTAGPYSCQGKVECVKAVFGKKPLEGVKRLGVSIGQESLARILGQCQEATPLEDGEVDSSADSDAEKKCQAGDGEIEESAGSTAEVSETGSLSDSSHEKPDGKAKKKKKHKHKHKRKKKKKHRHKQEESPVKDIQPTKGRSPKESGEKKKEYRPKDKKKHGKRRSRSDEKLDSWDARSYRELEESSALSFSSNQKCPLQNQGADRSRCKEDSRKQSFEQDRSKKRSKCREDSRRQSSEQNRSRERSRSREDSRRQSSEPVRSYRGKHWHPDPARDSDLRIRIDKNKLRKIAIARALANMQKGQGPSVDLLSVRSGGKSVAELTEFCKRISEKEKDGGANESSDSESNHDDHISDQEDAPLHHPFKMRDPSVQPNIVMNIRNARQLPVLTPQEKQTQAAQLRTQFPVSSGTQHRIKESEWVPVIPATTITKTKTTSATVTVSSTGATGGHREGDNDGKMADSVSTTAATSANQSVFTVCQPTVNIGSIISERIQAMRRLEENPFDVQALTSVHRMNEQAQAWAQAQNLPGQFTGSTDVRILTQQELAGTDKRHQAWAKKDQFRNAPPLQGGIGMFLLQKMGWKPGDGLGKDNEGSREPLLLDVKMDRKGLSASQETQPVQAGRGPVAPVASVRVKDLSGKHPVSALTELCSKRHWGAPAFELISETGPAHKRMFHFKVKVNSVEYIPSTACGNKKLAKAQAAAVCLQEMGLVPADFILQI